MMNFFVKYSFAAAGGGGGGGVGRGVMSRQGRLWYFGGELAVERRHPWYYFDPSCLSFLSPGSSKAVDSFKRPPWN